MRLRIPHVNTHLTRFPAGILALAGVALLSATMAACSASLSDPGSPAATSGMASPADTQVSISSLAFMPPSVSVKAGSKVTWRNDEPITHTVTSGTFTGVDMTTGLRSGQAPDGLFNARLEGQGDTFTYTFTKPGTYTYYCDIHFGMNATVVVTP